MTERLLTAAEVADKFRVRPPTILAWRKAGILPEAARRPVRRGAWLFRESDVEALLAARSSVAPPDGPSVSDVEAIIAAEQRLASRRGA